MKFLIDECLHTSLVEVAQARDHEATHVTWRGLGGVQDWNLMEPIREGDFVFVTNNARDFRKLYAREEVHAGLIIIVPNAPPDRQRILFDHALDALEADGDLVNQALEVAFDGDDILIRRYDLPPGR